MFLGYRDWECGGVGTDRQTDGPRSLGSILWAKGSLWSYSGATVAGRVRPPLCQQAHRERTPREECPPHGRGASDSFLG